VNKIITDIAVISIDDKGLVLTEIAEGWSIEQVQSLTEPKLLVSNKLNRYVTK
jgi:3-oxoacid CoA-transferase subunit B